MSASPTTWLTVEEAARYLRVARTTLYRLRYSGELTPDGKVGSRWRYSTALLDRYVRRIAVGEPAVDPKPPEVTASRPDDADEAAKERFVRRAPRTRAERRRLVSAEIRRLRQKLAAQDLPAGR